MGNLKYTGHSCIDLPIFLNVAMQTMQVSISVWPHSAKAEAGGSSAVAKTTSPARRAKGWAHFI